MPEVQCNTKDLLASIINGTDICTLCLKSIEEDSYDLYDEVVFQAGSGANVLFVDVLSSLLALQERNLAITNKLCADCVRTALVSYNFIKMCHNSRQVLSNIISNISDSICNLEDQKAKTLYITTDVNNAKCKKLYDKYCSVDVTGALRRYKILAKKRKSKRKELKREFEIEISQMDDFPENESGHDADSDCNATTVCKCCSRQFPDRKCLRAHFVRVHAPKNFKCNECPKKFGAAYLLRLHKSESHISVMCAECGKKYNNIHSLKMHSFTHAQLVCPLCDRSYKTRNSYRKHVKSKICTKERIYGTAISIHERKYICDICSKGFAQKASLQVHIKFKHGNGDKYSCNWCEKKFPAQSRLKAHIVKHTKERNFTCEVCGGKFVSKAALIYHTRIHTGETPYSCPECDQKFLSASRRMDHVRRKHMGPTLECDVCGSKFRTPSSLKKHKKRHFNQSSRLFVQSLDVSTGLSITTSDNKI